MCWICDGWRSLGPDATMEDRVAWARQHGVDALVDDQGDILITLYPPAKVLRRTRTQKKRSKRR